MKWTHCWWHSLETWVADWPLHCSLVKLCFDPLHKLEQLAKLENFSKYEQHMQRLAFTDIEKLVQNKFSSMHHSSIQGQTLFLETFSSCSEDLIYYPNIVLVLVLVLCWVSFIFAKSIAEPSQAIFVLRYSIQLPSYPL